MSAAHRIASVSLTPKVAPVVHLEGIAKGYGKGSARTEALKGIDLEVEEGAFIALTGPSGSGKSTLLNILGLLDQADHGTYLLAGRDTSGLSQKQLTMERRAALGFIFQGFNLIPVLSVLENVEYPLLLGGVGAGERERRVLALLDQVGLTGLAGRLPDSLSGGQKQRVAIARALVTQPRLVLADEPTANLDGATARQIVDLMAHLGHHQRTTFVVATHDSRLTSRCDRVVALTDGVLGAMS